MGLHAYSGTIGKWLGRGALALVFATTAVSAQPEAAKPAATPDAEVKFRKGSQLTVAEQLTQSQNYLTKMKVVQARAEKLAKRARTDKDLIKLNCVNDKLIRIKGSLRVAEGNGNTLRIAASRNDDGARNHEFSKLTILFQKVTVLGQEAEACIGEEITYVGKAKVTVEIDPEVLKAGDPTTEPPPPLPVIRPPIASPFI
ncbi:MAG: hypothetical protein JRH20_28135 [Deltaproteobacteria bacterium]|nr:hypothetical protein [Deltaproteobacteria bacterium]